MIHEHRLRLHGWSRQRIGHVQHALNRDYRLPRWMLRRHNMDSLSEWGPVGEAECEQATPDHLVEQLIMHLNGINPRCRAAH